MNKCKFLKVSTFLLTRKNIFIYQNFEKSLGINPFIHKEKQMNTNKSQNANKNFKATKATKATKRIYYKFLCKCGSGFDTFPEFLGHVKTFHQVGNVDFQEILNKRSGYEREIKFYWSLHCQCGHKFSSSLCNAELKVNEGNIELLKKYYLRCLKCKEIAEFDEEILLINYLEERFKQNLIYSYFKEKFNIYKNDSHSKKILEGHIRELCEKCKQSPTGFCGSDLRKSGAII